MIKMSQFLAKLCSVKGLLSRFPSEPEVRPKKTGSRGLPVTTGSKISRIAVQLVYDKFYFLLFREIITEIKSRTEVTSDLLVVQSINGGVGIGLQARLLRSLPISWLRSSQWIRAFGNEADGIGYRSLLLEGPVRELRNWQKAKRLWRYMRAQPGKKSLVVDNIEIADLVIDTYLRFRPSPFFDIDDPFFISIIRQALRDLRKSREYFERAKPSFYLTSYSTYLEHGIASRVALSLGIIVECFGSPLNFVKTLTPEDPFHKPACGAYRRDFEKMADSDKKLSEARTHLEARLSGDVDAATVYMRQSAYAKGPEKLPESVKGSVIIFLHDFYDSPHVYSDMVFDDFWEWVCFTVEVLTQSGIRFFIKPHPNQVALSDQALDELKSKYPEIKWLASDTSNVSLVDAGISCGVTVYGTVAHELAFLGVPTICSAKHPHHSFEFCRTAKSVAEYKEMLLSYEVLPASKKVMRDQALAFYYMHNLSKSPQEMELNSKYLDFWKVCNVGDFQSAQILEAFSELTDSQGFKGYIDDLVAQINGGKNY